MESLIFKLKIMSLFLNPKWFLTGITYNYFMDSSDNISTLPENGLILRKIQHNYINYSFVRKGSLENVETA